MTQPFAPRTINKQAVYKGEIAGWQNHQGRKEMTQEKGWGAGFSKERYFWMIFSALLVIAIIGFSLHCSRLRDRLRKVWGEREVLLTKIETSQRLSLLTSSDIAHLARQGISNPEEDLAVDLMQHRELIPYEGIMGGSMGFYSQKDIHILSSRWVLASFEDGHIGGNMLLEYRVDPGRNISWKVLSAYLD